MTDTIYKIIKGIAIVAFVASFIHSNQKTNETLEMVNALQDTVKVYTDEYGDKITEISQIRTSDPKVFVNVKTDDKRVQELQAEVDKYKSQLEQGGSVTQFESSTHINTPLILSTTEDGKIKGTASDSTWYQLETTFDPISKQVESDVKIKNDYTVAIVEDDGQVVVKIKNRNPYSTEGEVRTYAKLPKDEKKWGIGPFVGYDPIKGSTIGVGISYHIFEWN